jgi:secondary thiamine-phosphate synthase enzyme
MVGLGRKFFTVEAAADPTGALRAQPIQFLHYEPAGESVFYRRIPPVTLRKTEANILNQAVHQFTIATRGEGLYEFTSTLNKWVESQRMHTGLLTIFCRHTSASLLVQENADPTVQRDIRAYFDRLAPTNGPYEHNYEGLDDMPAHLKTALTQVQLSIPVMHGGLVLGTWQGVYLFEHRVRPHRREIVLHLIGELELAG